MYGLRDRAAEAFDAVVRAAMREPRPGTAEALLSAAQLLWRQGRMAEAESAFGAALSKYPDHMPIRQHYARVCMRLGRPIKALGLLSPLIASGVLHPREIEPLVQTIGRLRNFETARPQVEMVWSKHKSARPLVALYVEICLRGFDLAGATGALDEYSTACPEDRSFDDLRRAVAAADWPALTHHFYMAKSFPTAIVLARHTLSLKPQKPPVAQILARSLAQVGKWEEALEALELFNALTGHAEEPWSEEIRELADPQAYCRRLMQRYALDDSTWIFVAHVKSGDHFYFFSLMKAFKEQQRRTGNVDRITVLINPSHRGIAELFADDLDRVELLERASFRAVWAATTQIRPGVPLVPSTVLLRNPDKTYRTLLPNDIVQYSDWLKFTLGLPLSTPLTPPTVTAEARRRALEFMRANGMPQGNSVILAPWAWSMAKLPHEVWTRLAARLKARGHAVFLNVGPEGQPPELAELRPISFSHDIAIPLVEEAGSIVVNRSGLADIVAAARSTIAVTYARKLGEKGKPWPYRDRWVLNHFSPPGRKLAEIECFVDEAPGDTVERILSTSFGSDGPRAVATG